MANKGLESTEPRKGNGAEEFIPMPAADQNTREAGRSEQNSVLELAKNTAGDAYNKITEKTFSSIESKKAGVTGGIKSIAQTIRSAGDQLDTGDEASPITDYSARYATAAADKLEGVAEYFDERDFKAIKGDIESYARRNPAIFIGAAFGVGLLVARFLKSSSQVAAARSDARSGSDTSANKRSQTAQRSPAS